MIGGAIVAVLIGGFLLMSNNNSNTQNETVPVENVTNSNDTSMTNNDDQPKSMNIVETAQANEDFSTLVTAVTQADLGETLSGEGPFTVFAPTNAAFEKLPEGTLESVLEDKEKLKSILTFHVVPGSVMSSDLSDGMVVKTVQGQEIKISVTDEGVMVNDAKVVTADIKTSNGVIHVIDSVLLPE